jgi:DNA uptake protein ComE-like DNA-binding protein
MNDLKIALLLSAAFALAACTTESAKTADSAAAANTPPPAAAPGPVDSGAAVAAPTGTTSGAMIDPDAATAADLATIPGVTPELASSIVAARPFSDMTAVDKVLAKSLSEQQRDSVYARVWKPIDLNKASDEEILLIPGIGRRMLREFKEYRPYTSIEQFRREIGKYVDKDEVARLERYVRI